MKISEKKRKLFKKITHPIYYVISLSFLDHYVEKKLRKQLYKKKQKYFDDALADFIKHNPDVDDAHIQILKEKLLHEENRIYDIVDKSLLHAGVKRAKLILVATFIVTAILLGIVAVLTHGSGLIFLPLIAPLIAYIATVLTIRISYNDRIIGGLNAVIHAYEQELKKENNNTESLILSSKCEEYYDEAKITTRTIYEFFKVSNQPPTIINDEILISSSEPSSCNDFFAHSDKQTITNSDGSSPMETNVRRFGY